MFEAYCREKIGPLALRIGIGLFFAYHGFVKIMAGGGTAWYPEWSVGWQVVIAWAEFAAALAILVGFRCRVAALVVLVVMLLLLLWMQGWRLLHMPLASLELTLLALLTVVALLFLGPGELSLDGRAGGKGPRKH